MNEKLLIRYGILVAAILELCIWLLTKKKSFIRENGRMPFIWNRELNLTVKNYLETDPSNQILVISGPYKSGKSQILEQISDNLIRVKRFPLIMRADQSVTIEDLVDSIKISCLKTIDELSNQMTPVEIQKYGTLSLSSMSFSKKRDHPLFSRAATNLYSHINSIGLANMYHYMETVADSLLVVDKDPDLFFDLVNRIDLVIKPYVLIFGFNNLRKLKSKNGAELGSIFYNHSFNRFIRRSQYTEYVPYILEITDTGVFLNKTSRHIFESDQFVYGFTDLIENFIDEVSRKRSLFTQKEALYLQENFGGHGGSVSYVFHEMQVKRPIQESTETLNSKLNVQLSQTVKNTSDPVWYQICSSKGNKGKNQVITNEGEVQWHEIWPSGRKLLKPLIKRGLIYTNVSKIIKPAHPGVYRYICSVAKKPGWSFKNKAPKKKKEAPKVVRKINITNEFDHDENSIYSQSLNERLNTTLNVTLNNTDANETHLNQTSNINETSNVNETLDVNQTLDVNETDSESSENVQEKNETLVKNDDEKNEEKDNSNLKNNEKQQENQKKSDAKK